MSFKILALPIEPLAHLFTMDDEQLKANQAARLIVDNSPGFPCRVSLADANMGETIILTHYQHQNCDSPFRSSHAIYVRQQAKQVKLATGIVPICIESRLISLRAFDDRDFIIDAEVIEGTMLNERLSKILQNLHVQYVHLHYAKLGCFAAKVIRYS